MPGREYFASIVDFWRVYAGHTPEGADACEAFLSRVVNTRDYPLTRLADTTSSELAKILENSYRAVNIAFMEEWGRFAETIGVDIFPVIEAIRRRPTHQNLRQPGFGVGGYCLTKDPLLGGIAAREFFGRPDLTFPFCDLAVAANRDMPLVSLSRVEALLGGSLAGKTLLLLGVSYRQDVGDTRYAPAETLVRAARARGARVLCHDPYLDFWPELEETMPRTLPAPDFVDAVVFAVPHAPYLELDLGAWLNGATPLIFDANHVLTAAQLDAAQAVGCLVAAIGRGDLP
jgi:nucleotide sugar dehydrogenase